MTDKKVLKTLSQNASNIELLKSINEASVQLNTKDAVGHSNLRGSIFGQARSLTTQEIDERLDNALKSRIEPLGKE